MRSFRCWKLLDLKFNNQVTLGVNLSLWKINLKGDSNVK